MKECSVRQVGKDMIEIRFQNREIEYAKQNGAFTCIIKFKEKPHC